MHLLVLGGSGLLGSDLMKLAIEAGSTVAGTFATGPTRVSDVRWMPLDVRDRSATAALVRRVAPDVIINAAYRQSEWATTADGAANAAAAAVQAGARFVHVSSDAVFSGADSPYAEAAEPDPITPYGAAKAAAETAVRVIAPNAIIARTSLIISSDGTSSHERRTHAAVNGEGTLFVDDIRCPIHVTDLARALLELSSARTRGIHHLAGADAVSRYELGRMIARRDGLDPEHIKRGYRAELPDPGPLDVRLDCVATQRALGTKLRGAKEFLDEG